MNRRVDMRQAREPLEATYSRAEVMEHLGCKATTLWHLMQLGRKHHGPALLKGGLWPWFRPTHKNVRITRTAIERHKRHMERLQVDAMFAAEMKAKARGLEPHAAT
jgi:hypothetical protein